MTDQLAQDMRDTQTVSRGRSAQRILDEMAPLFEEQRGRIIKAALERLRSGEMTGPEAISAWAELSGHDKFVGELEQRVRVGEKRAQEIQKRRAEVTESKNRYYYNT